MFKKKKIKSIRFSTRPDSINEKNLNLLKKFSIKTIEIGAQSMNDKVLDASKRGHKAIDTVIAGKQIKKNGYKLGLQIMTGLPQDNERSLLNSAKQIAEIKPDFIRIYPCVVLKDTMLAKMYKEKKFIPQTLEESILQVKKLYLFF